MQVALANFVSVFCGQPVETSISVNSFKAFGLAEKKCETKNEPKREKELEDFYTRDLRMFVRRNFPETRGVGSLAHFGNKMELIDFLRKKGVTPFDLWKSGIRQTVEKRNAVKMPGEVWVSPCRGQVRSPGTDFSSDRKKTMKSDYSSFSDREIVRALNLMVSREDLRVRSVAEAILREFDFSREDIAEQLQLNEPIEGVTPDNAIFRLK